MREKSLARVVQNSTQELESNYHEMAYFRSSCASGYNSRTEHEIAEAFDMHLVGGSFVT